MEQKDCVHEMLKALSKYDKANPGSPGEESQIDQLSELMVDVMRDHNHGSASNEHIEGAILGARLLFLRVIGLVANGDLEPEIGHIMQHLVGEMGLVLSRVYNSGAGTVAELEELWNL